MTQILQEVALCPVGGLGSILGHPQNKTCSSFTIGTLCSERPPFRDVLDDRDEMQGSTVPVAVDRHVDPGPEDGAVSPSKSLFSDHVAVQGAQGHLSDCLRLSSRVFRLDDLLNGTTLQLFSRVGQEIAQALIDHQPSPVQADVHDSNRRGVECRSVETLALDQVGGAIGYWVHVGPMTIDLPPAGASCAAIVVRKSRYASGLAM